MMAMSPRGKGKREERRLHMNARHRAVSEAVSHRSRNQLLVTDRPSPRPTAGAFVNDPSRVCHALKEEPEIFPTNQLQFSVARS